MLSCSLSYTWTWLLRELEAVPSGWNDLVTKGACLRSAWPKTVSATCPWGFPPCTARSGRSWGSRSHLDGLQEYPSLFLLCSQNGNGNSLWLNVKKLLVYFCSFVIFNRKTVHWFECFKQHDRFTCITHLSSLQSSTIEVVSITLFL